MDLNNLPEGFDPGNLPDGFNQDTIPDSSVNGESRPDLSGNVPDGADSPSEMQSSPDTQANGNAPDSAAGSTNGKRPSFSGMPGQPSGQANGKNLITLGICLAAMLILLFVMNRIKRKKY